MSFALSASSCARDQASSAVNCKSSTRPCLAGTADIALRTSKGTVVLRLDGANAPLTAGNFIDLVRRGVYSNTVFHRVVRTPLPFVVQGGDPLSANPKTPASLYGTGNFVDPGSGEARYVPLEFRLKASQQFVYGQLMSSLGKENRLVLTHDRGAIAMARSSLPNSASAQFYIALEALPELDGQYAVFGRVIRGMDIVDQLEQGDKLLRADLLDKK
ncbi:MAG: peptidylprolyl isomerase [Cyanobacteriota bacterium]|jgi:peptidyl-prolyl cis-trans isomerase B (cyclophilin B)